jgi:hypothetical protein
MQAGMALSHLFAGRFDMASSWAEQSFRQLPRFLMVVAIIAASQAAAANGGGEPGAIAAKIIDQPCYSRRRIMLSAPRHFV